MNNVMRFPLKPTKDGRPDGVELKNPIQLEKYLAYRFLSISSKLTFYGAIEIDDIPLKSRDWRILLLIASTGPCTNQKLSELMFMPPATVSRAISYLKGHGLIEVRRSKRDKRSSLIGLTNKGAAVYDELAGQTTSYINALESRLDAKKLDLLYCIFDDIEELMCSTAIEYNDWEHSAETEE